MKDESDLFEKLVICKCYHWKGRKFIRRSPQKFDHIYARGNGYQKLQHWRSPVPKWFIMIYIPHVASKKFLSSYYAKKQSVLAGFFASVCKVTRFCNDKCWTRQ